MRNKVMKGALIGLVGVFVLLLSSCAEMKLRIGVEVAKQQCPISMGIGQIEDIDYEGDEVKILYVVNDKILDIDDLASQPELLRTTVRAGLNNKYAKKVIDLMDDADANLNFVFKGRYSGKETKVTLTPGELKGRF